MTFRLDGREKEFIRKLGEASKNELGYLDIEPWRSVPDLETKEMIAVAYSLRSKKLIAIKTDRPPFYQLTLDGLEFYESDRERLKELERIGLTEQEEALLQDAGRAQMGDPGRHKLSYYDVFDQETEPQKKELALSLEQKRFVMLTQDFRLQLDLNGLKYFNLLRTH
jgi:hypothetical protein